MPKRCAQAAIGPWVVGIPLGFLMALILPQFIHQRTHEWIMLGPAIRSVHPTVLGTELPVSEWQRLSVLTYKSAAACRDEIATRTVSLGRLPMRRTRGWVGLVLKAGTLRGTSR